MAYVVGSPITGTIWLRDYSEQPILDATFAGADDILEAFDEDGTAATLTIAQINKGTKPGAYRWSFTPTTSGKDWTGHIVYDNNGVRREWSEDFRVLTAAQADPAAALSDTVTAVDAINARLTDARVAKLDRIGSASVTYSSPVVGDETIELYQGYDYLAADGRAVEWSLTGMPDLTGATVTLTITHRKTDPLTVTGTVSNAGAATQTVSVDLTAEQTAALNPYGATYFDLSADLANGHTVPLLRGTVDVIEAQS